VHDLLDKEVFFDYELIHERLESEPETYRKLKVSARSAILAIRVDRVRQPTSRLDLPVSAGFTHARFRIFFLSAW